MVDVADPFAMTAPVPVMEEFAATGKPAIKTAFPPVFETGVAIERAFVSAVNEARVQVETPVAFEAVQVP